MNKILIKLILLFVVTGMTFAGHVLHENGNANSFSSDMREAIEIENII